MNSPLQDDKTETRHEAVRISQDHSGDPALALSGMFPFRISSLSEMILARKITMQSTNLKIGEFAENSWGFPFVLYPYVNPDPVEGSHRQVPPHVSYAYIGYPIFWIDPHLTQPTPAENADPVRWNIRMFYLLMGLGMLDPKTLQWYNSPASKDISYNESDIKNYMADYPSPLDSVRITEADLLVPLAEINASTAVALNRISVMQNKERERFGAMQRSAFHDGTSLIAGDQSWEILFQSAVNISYEASLLAINGKPNSHLVDKMFTIKDEIVEHLSNIESLTLILTAPILSELSYTTSMYSKVASLSGAFHDNVVHGQYNVSIHNVLNHLFEKGGFIEDTPSATVFSQLIQTHYGTAIQRLELAVDNYNRIARGEQIYSSVTEKDVFDQVIDLNLN